MNNNCKVGDHEYKQNSYVCIHCKYTIPAHSPESISDEEAAEEFLEKILIREGGPGQHSNSIVKEAHYAGCKRVRAEVLENNRVIGRLSNINLNLEEEVKQQQILWSEVTNQRDASYAKITALLAIVEVAEHGLDTVMINAPEGGNKYSIIAYEALSTIKSLKEKAGLTSSSDSITEPGNETDNEHDCPNTENLDK